MRCLSLTESKYPNYCPKIDQAWWDKVENIYIDIRKDIPSCEIIKKLTEEENDWDKVNTWELEMISYALQTYNENKTMEINIGFFKIIEFLGLAEKKEFIPQLPTLFWQQINDRYKLYVPCKPYMYKAYDKARQKE